MSIIPIPNNRWTKTDKIAYLSLVVSVVALVLSCVLSIFGYRSQSRYNELQNTLLLTQNYPELKYMGFQIVTWLQDDQPFLSVTLKNIGKVGAMGLKVEGGFAGDRREYTHSQQSGFYDPRFTLMPEQELLCPLVPQQELEQDVQKAHPGYQILRFVDDPNYLASDKNPNVFKQLGIPEARNGEMQELFLFPAGLNVKYHSILGQELMLYIPLYVVEKRSLQ